MLTSHHYKPPYISLRDVLIGKIDHLVCRPKYWIIIYYINIYINVISCLGMIKRIFPSNHYVVDKLDTKENHILKDLEKIDLSMKIGFMKII